MKRDGDAERKTEGEKDRHSERQTFRGTEGDVDIVERYKDQEEERERCKD